MKNTIVWSKIGEAFKDLICTTPGEVSKGTCGLSFTTNNLSSRAGATLLVRLRLRNSFIRNSVFFLDNRAAFAALRRGMRNLNERENELRLKLLRVLRLLSKKKKLSKTAPHLPKGPGLEEPSWSLDGSEMNPRDDSTRGPFGGSLGGGGGIYPRMDRKNIGE